MKEILIKLLKKADKLLNVKEEALENNLNSSKRKPKDDGVKDKQSNIIKLNTERRKEKIKNHKSSASWNTLCSCSFPIHFPFHFQFISKCNLFECI